MYPLDLETLVVENNWKEMLINLVESEKLDPWSIDIVVIADKFLQKIKMLQVLDLHVAANVILASSILLRMKTETLLFEATQVEEQNGEVEEKQTPNIPQLNLKLRLPPPRRLTLQELIKAVEEIMKIQQRIKKVVNVPQQTIQIDLNEKDLDTLINETFEKIKKSVDPYGLVTFSQLLTKKDCEEVLKIFVPLLHLEKGGKVSLFQEEFFGEIFIKLL
ncbi:MAG: segregation/condensation protein A [Candidatus Micrarchaeia archaeon]|jgi:segregation and condensation protein A